MATIDRAEPLLSEHLPRLLTVEDVADVLGVNARTVRRLVARGDLTRIRIGGSVRYDPRDVRALIQRGIDLKENAP
jgi:excisionase family DNA binding protein